MNSTVIGFSSASLYVWRIQFLLLVWAHVGAYCADPDWNHELLELKIAVFQDALPLGQLDPVDESILADVMLKFQAYVTKVSGGDQLPVFISPEVALIRIPAHGREQLGAPLYNVSVKDGLRYLCDIVELEWHSTAFGIVIRKK